MRELFEALAQHAAARGRTVAFDDGESRLSYAELAARVAGFAEELRPLPSILGLLGSNRVAWVVAQLAAWLAGKTVVPLPAFFQLGQLQHILRDAGIAHLVATPEAIGMAERLGLPVTAVSRRSAGGLAAAAGAAAVIYTSGTTGRPKGVKLNDGQLAWSAAALAKITAAGPEDLYLSVMPFALLLETISAIMVPILSGARVRLDPELAEASGMGRIGPLARTFAAVRPTGSVLVPQLLAAWVGQLNAAAIRAPDSLRLIAVGGAPIPPALAARAWQLGIPVYEGYGLSECGSVVAVNRPDARKPGTVGKPLPDLDVRIEAGEIVVCGPSVMAGYVRGVAPHGVWRTGDLGALDGEGFLTVHGRRDNLLVTSFGRNVSPEWIEAMLLGDPRVRYCMVAGGGRPYLTVLLVPSAAGASWFARATPAEVHAFIETCCRAAPDYAVPRAYLVVPAEALTALERGSGNGRLRRAALHEHFGDALDALYARDAERLELEPNP